MISLSHFKILFQMLFLVRVTSTEYNWVSLAEGRHSIRGQPTESGRVYTRPTAESWLIRFIDT